MANVIVRNEDCDDVVYEGVESVVLNTADGGTQMFTAIVETPGGGGKWTSNGGSYKPTTTGEISVAHGLGTVPDCVLVWSTASKQSFDFQVAMSKAFAEKCGFTIWSMAHFNGTTGVGVGMETLTLTSPYAGLIYGADEEVFKLGSSVITHDTSNTYNWIALALA